MFVGLAWNLERLSILPALAPPYSDPYPVLTVIHMLPYTKHMINLINGMDKQTQAIYFTSTFPFVYSCVTQTKYTILPYNKLLMFNQT